ncbi:hypothetical protein [Bacillus sp. OK048]|uniref:hypothetical protein n=1 Tax=Bacillus sp. OK048 TaxID=1882761 RepID=UPI00088D4383|nr:hypothetical protein [Bacillus sp. OK048]SDN32232.1 hypothetical protein SAMN05443253_11087 [Bacillus sp. OK048]
MKKFLSLLCGSLILVLMFTGTANPVKAASPTNVLDSKSDTCECHAVTPIYGMEKYKIILNLLGSKEFSKTTKKLLKDGYYWNITAEIEVLKHNQYGTIMVGVPFKSIRGTSYMAAFFDGVYMGISPADAPHQ